VVVKRAARLVGAAVPLIGVRRRRLAASAGVALVVAALASVAFTGSALLPSTISEAQAGPCGPYLGWSRGVSALRWNNCAPGGTAVYLYFPRYNSVSRRYCVPGHTDWALANNTGMYRGVRYHSHIYPFRC